MWSQVHCPANYHAIGINHAYGYCQLLKKRCSEVTKNECLASLKNANEIMNKALEKNIKGE